MSTPDTTTSTTTETNWLSAATSLLTAASGPSSAVAATANLLTEGLKLLEPVLANHETNQYENDKKARIQTALDILALPDGPARRQRLGDYAAQLLLNAGAPVPGGMGAVPLVGVRVEFLLAAFSAIAGKICDDAYLTALTQNAVKGQPAK